MTNETFILLSDEEKNVKLKTVLKNKSRNCLTDEEISIIMVHVKLNRQYTIRTYTNPAKFLAVLAVSSPCDCCTVIGSAVAGAAEVSMTMFTETNTAAVIAKSVQDGNEMYFIHIYIPSSRLQRSDVS